MPDRLGQRGSRHRAIHSGCHKPFNGAYTFVGEAKVRLLDSQVFDHEDFGYENEKEGTIIEVFPSGKFLVSVLAVSCS